MKTPNKLNVRGKSTTNTGIWKMGHIQKGVGDAKHHSPLKSGDKNKVPNHL